MAPTGTFAGVFPSLVSAVGAGAIARFMQKRAEIVTSIFVK